MQVTHVIPYFSPEKGGPVLSLAGYAQGLKACGVEVTIVTARHCDDGETIQLDGVPVKIVRSPALGRFRWSPDFPKYLGMCAPTIIHSHGLWTFASWSAQMRSDLPHIVAPCGMLQPEALKHSRWKKQICRLLFQDRVLRKAACLHAKSQAEAEQIRALGFTQPIAVVPNPVGPPSQTLSPEEFRKQYQIPDKPCVTFIGRIHPVKGLERLIRAWASQQTNTWHLVLAGPDEGGYLATLRKVATSLGCQDRISFPGPLAEDAKWALLRCSHLFVLPSDFENFGTAAVEAMQAGLPVITTTGTPWRQLQQQDCGWWVPPTVGALHEALHDAMALPTTSRQQKGTACQKIGRKFSSDTVAQQLLSVYQWLLQQQDMPESVDPGTP